MPQLQSWTKAGTPSAFADLVYGYEPEDARVTGDALRQAEQVAAGMAADRGMVSPRGTQTNLQRRMSTDILSDARQRQLENKRQWAQTQSNIRTPVQTPSTWSSLLSPIGQGLTYDLALRGPNSMVGKGAGALGGAVTNAFSGGGTSVPFGGSAADYATAYSNLINSGYGSLGSSAPYAPAAVGTEDYGIGEEAISGLIPSESGSSLGDWLGKAWGAISNLWG